VQRKVLTLVVGLDDGVVQTYFGIEHESKLWLVTAWLIERATGEATPERMIRVDSLIPAPQRCQPGEKIDYVNILLPRAVIDGVSQETAGYEVRSLPDSPRVQRRDLYTLPSLFD